MVYTEVRFDITPLSEVATDIMAGLLVEIGYESFVNTETGMLAYITKPEFDKTALQECISGFPLDVDIKIAFEDIADKNWNEEWEKNYFQPIIIGDECVIHSTFHTNIPKAKFDIVIDPKMAFGTGHHQTTSLVLREIIKADMKGKVILDMGCGTAVLGILAAMKGAQKVTAIDIDRWAYENALENIQLNSVPSIQVGLGGAEQLGAEIFDIIFANINRNILLNDLHVYASCMKKDSVIFMSGFYVEDIPYIEAEAGKYGLKMDYYREDKRWVVTRFTKMN